MSKILTNTQRQVLDTLIKLYTEKRRAIKSKEIAEVLGKDEVTIRSIIGVLKGQRLVASKKGPLGGYVPTLKAYELLSVSAEPREASAVLEIIGSHGNVTRLIAQSLEITRYFGVRKTRAIIKVKGDLSRVTEGCRARLRSLSEGFLLEGRIARIEPLAGEVMIDVTRLSIVPDEMVGNIIKRKLLVIPRNTSIREASRILYVNRIRGAPVVDDHGNVVGIITTTDIAMLIANKVDPEEPVDHYVRKGVFTISESDSIIDAIRLMNYYGVGRLLVTDNKGKPVGIITRTDILTYIAALSG
ncbi:MAG: CBS domain-containing protein [Desulfurococcales archaeon]|nr:CBS domain-containing protein [Desulfurococcales archaeon]